MAKTKAIDADKRYKITISKSFEHDGVKFIPRIGTNYKVSGAVLEQIKDNVDAYEEI